MGDRRRFRVVAEFLCRAFPGAHRIADVGGGHGRLSVELRLRGRWPVVVDPRGDLGLPKAVRRHLRRHSMKTGCSPTFPRIHARIEDIDLSRFDLIVGLHPDQATEPLIRRAVACGLPFAVVPCCVMPLDGIRRSYQQWLEYLRSLAPHAQLCPLPFDGRNLVVFDGHQKTTPLDEGSSKESDPSPCRPERC